MNPCDQPHHVYPPKNFKRPPKILFWDIFGKKMDAEALIDHIAGDFSVE